jgi:hypothetical protein
MTVFRWSGLRVGNPPDRPAVKFSSQILHFAALLWIFKNQPLLEPLLTKCAIPIHPAATTSNLQSMLEVILTKRINGL